MKHEISYIEIAKTTSRVIMHFEPAEFLEYDNEMQVMDAMESMISNIDYGDPKDVEVESVALEVPAEFWDEWKSLKASKGNDNI